MDKEFIEEIEDRIRKYGKTGSDDDFLMAAAYAISYGICSGGIYVFGNPADMRDDGGIRFGLIDKDDDPSIHYIPVFTSKENAAHAMNILGKAGIHQELMQADFSEVLMAVHMFPEIEGVYVNIGTPIMLFLPNNIISSFVAHFLDQEKRKQ